MKALLNPKKRRASNSSVGAAAPRVFLTRITCLCKIWGDYTFDLLADETNRYAAQKGIECWEDVSAEEMQSFIGVQLAMGMVRLPSMYNYWSTNPILSAPGIVKGMG